MKQSASNPSASRSTEQLWHAVLRRDARWDGRFVLAVLSTGIYCRPSCPARRPLRRNVRFFTRPEEAERAGFRSCLRCRPKEVHGAAALVERAARHLARHAGGDEEKLSELAAALGTSAGALRRAFRSATGLAPREFAAAARVAHFKKELRAGKSVTEALYACGYGSPSRVYERSNAHLGMTPAAYRRGGATMKIRYAIADSTLGKVLIGSTERGISAVYLGAEEKKLRGELRKEYPRAEIFPGNDTFSKWVREIVERIAGRPPRLDLPLDVQATAFQRRVWQELQKIPFGATRTYTQIARQLGKPRAVRAVARACATNPVSIVVPCHRVIRADGSLAGYRWGLERKQKLLAREKEAG
ncbi:MAG: bifunctional DNA-binding transcriptional regulator/O6-methylguanine-DNA methyltransferase Ada [Acidobacteriia bacterium]|nr:bifunctional DNA-binding transcriptional regulator/O6-methylguanine-DNA methyltransferase Ada [Terriglobia bacterium]